MSAKPGVSVVIPIQNEEESLGICIEKRLDCWCGLKSTFLPSVKTLTKNRF